MAALLLLLAIVGATVVGDLVLENTGTGAVTLLNHPITGYSDGLLLAVAAAIGFVVGLLVVGSLSRGGHDGPAAGSCARPNRS